MSESLLGRIVNFTSQCAGTVIAAAFAGPPAPAGPASGPAAIVAADVIVAPESLRVVRPSHDCWAKTVEAEANVTAIARIVRFDTEPSSSCLFDAETKLGHHLFPHSKFLNFPG